MEHSNAPHILALPLPGEGHVKPIFNLAKLLSHRGHKITFVNTHHNHNRLLQFTDLASFHTQFPNFHFASITDGIPNDHPPHGPPLNYFRMLISPSARSLAAKEFRELFITLSDKNGEWQPPSCIIADGLMSTIALSVAQEFRVPFFAFRTYSATCTWVTIHMSKLFHTGALLQDNMEHIATSIPGLENLLRPCDLPSYLTLLNDERFNREFFIEETLAMIQASGLILNTFEQLEPSIITMLATIFPKVYSIGPLHTLYKTILTTSGSSTNPKDGSLRKEDKSCITWLDHQKAKSVLYVSFGTVVRPSHEQLLEFWHGLVNSHKPFLWVIQKDLLGNNVPLELELGTKERGHLVDWAPQEEVLAHPAVGGFLTHSGWNSTLECIVEGLPMLCWPLITDQMVNSRCVSEQWKIGLDMNGTCDRFIIEKMVRDIMDNQMEEFMRLAKEIATKAQDSIKENGSSYHNLQNLIKDIMSIKVMN